MPSYSQLMMATCFAAIAAVMTACGRSTPPEAARSGALVVASVGEADVLFPPLAGTSAARQVTELVYDYLTETTPALNTLDDRSFATRLARSWTWSADSMSLAVRLNPGARWHDGRPVRSDDVAFTFRTYVDSLLGSPTASQLSNIDSVTANDSLTAVFWFRKRYPLQFYDATSQMQIIPKHIFGIIPRDSLRGAAADIKPTGSGRYRFVNWKRGESIELVADSANYRGSPKINRLMWRIFSSQESAARALLAGEVDVLDVLRPENVRDIATRKDLKTQISAGADYAFMAFNLQTPRQPRRPHEIFASRDLRRALTMAIDREAMTRNILDSLARPAVGPITTSLIPKGSALEQIPYDPVRAGKTLDSLGWRLDSKTGVRQKGSAPLRFKILVPTSSLNRMRIAVLLQEAFRKVGVAAEVDQMDNAAVSARVDARDFDAALLSWHLGTSPASIRQIWTSVAAGNGGLNYGSYASRTFDTSVDSAVTTLDPEKSKAYYAHAYQTAIDDAPAIWLYETNLTLGIHKRIRTAPYRPDAWWYSLADWYIPPNEQIPRDRIR